MSGGGMDDWRLCVDWLVRCHVISEDHPVAGRSAQLQDLASMLRDGVLLCNLLNRLHPGSIDAKNFSQHPQTSLFLCKRNVMSFLDACRTVFALPSTDLFDTFDLLQNADFSKVITTLSKLSLSARAMVTQNKPFRIKDKSSSPDYQNLSSFDDNDDDIYCNSGSGYDQYQKGAEEDIYGRLVDFVKLPLKETKSKADYCIQEIVTTEQSYVDVLKMIKEKFMKSLKTVLTPGEFEVIFKDIDVLYDIHCDFLAVLNMTVSSGSNDTLPDHLISFKERFIIYGDYCANLPMAQKLVEEFYKTSSPVQQAILNCEKEANDFKFKLHSLLVIPMQRVLKYHLFLKELIKQYPKEKSWMTALAEIEDLSLYVNEVKRDNEMWDNLNLIESSITSLPLPEGNSLKDYGRLQMDGELKIKAKKTKRHVFLLDKLLLICTPHGDSNAYESFLEVHTYEVEGTTAQDKSMSCYTFTLKPRRSATGEVYVFGAKTEEIAHRWIRAIQMAQDNMSPRYAHTADRDFRMSNFSTATICDVCRKLLRGAFYQGYKCQKN